MDRFLKSVPAALSKWRILHGSRGHFSQASLLLFIARVPAAAQQRFTKFPHFIVCATARERGMAKAYPETFHEAAPQKRSL